MNELEWVAQVDQEQAAFRDMGAARGRYWQALREAGVPRSVAAVLLVVHAWGSDVVGDCVEVEDDDL